MRPLADPHLARTVRDALYFFAGRRYDLVAYVIMPSHFHWVFRPLEPWVNNLDERTPRERIVHSIKRHTAKECNQRLQTTGRFWQPESYDHWVRDTAELERIVQYIEQNPVKAGLAVTAEQWEFSSAHDRLPEGLEPGMALPCH